MTTVVLGRPVSIGRQSNLRAGDGAEVKGNDVFFGQKKGNLTDNLCYYLWPTQAKNYNRWKRGRC